MVTVAGFSNGDLSKWQEKSFHGYTKYTLEQAKGVQFIKAESQASASGLFRKIRLELQQTPFLNWSWQSQSRLQDLNERSKSGDDYTARIYIVFSGGLKFWHTHAINYVWSGSQPVNSHWDNAFTSNAKMIAIDDAASPIGEWVYHQRDVLSDYRRLFGKEPGPVTAVAIMTDTDNSGRAASAWYGDIYFSSQ